MRPFLAVFLLVCALPAAAQKAIATFESIGLYHTPAADPGAAGCPVRYRKSGESSWKEGFPLWFDARNRECRGSLVHLAPGTKYEVEIAGQALTANTWDEKFPVSQTIKVESGKTLNITKGGTRDGYVLYTGPATIDGQDAEQFNVVIAAPYVIVRGLTLKGAKQDAIRVNEGAHDVVIEDNDVSGWGRLRNSGPGWQIGVDMDSGVRADCRRSPGKIERLIIQRNRIHDPRYGAHSWDYGHPAGRQGITISYCGGNHVLRNNEITSSDGHYYNDGIGGEDNFSDTGFPNADSDIYGNVVTHVWDDAIEAEGGNRNVRMWGNYLDQTGTGIASTVTHWGPLYIFRNVYNHSPMRSQPPPDADDRGPFFKAGSGDKYGNGRRYIFHNTAMQPTGSGQYPLGAGTGIIGNSKQPLTNTVSRNNVFQALRRNWAAINEAGGSGNDFDYDVSNGKLSEPHGISGGPDAGIDRGVRLPNFNDNFQGKAPDIGAQESGAPVLRFGAGGR